MADGLPPMTEMEEEEQKKGERRQQRKLNKLAELARQEMAAGTYRQNIEDRRRQYSTRKGRRRRGGQIMYSHKIETKSPRVGMTEPTRSESQAAEGKKERHLGKGAANSRINQKQMTLTSPAHS